eukprot:1192587-Prorocentrum_minimum.AAC.9
MSYVAFNFWVDLLSVLPLDYITSDLRFTGLFRLIRVKRIYQLNLLEHTETRAKRHGGPFSGTPGFGWGGPYPQRPIWIAGECETSVD